MALEKQIVNVEFNKGVDTKSEAMTIPGSLLLLQNGQFDKVGSINKRLPFELLSGTSANPGGVFPNAIKLLPFKKSLNVVTSRQGYDANPSRPNGPNETFYYDAQRDNYDRYEGTQSAIVETFPIIGEANIIPTSANLCLDSLTKNNLTYHLIAFDRAGTSGFSLYVTNSLDESLCFTTTVITGTVSRCAKLAILGNTLYIIYSTVGGAANLYLSSFDTSNLVNPTIGAPVTVVTDLGTNRDFDLDYSASLIFIAYNSSTANTIKVKSHDGSSIINAGTIADNATNGIAVAYASALPAVLIAYANTANEVRSQNFSTVIASLGAIFLISAEASAPSFLTVSGNIFDFSTDAYPVFWNIIPGAVLLNAQTKTALISTTAVIDAARIFCRSALISSKVFYFNSQHYIFIHYSSVYQSTNFLLHVSGYGANYKFRVVGRFFADQARISNVIYFVPRVVTIGNTVRTMAIANKFFQPLTGIENGNGVYEIVVYLTDERNFSGVEVANNSHIVGGMLSMYDGQTCYEHGFNHYPETPTLAQSNTAGGALTLLGTYQYTIVFQWVDAFGQVHRSAPSLPASITLTGANDTVTLTIPTYRITNRNDTEVIAKIYRTTSLGSNFQDIHPYAATALSIPHSADTTSWQDEMSDSTLLSQPFIYTTGGVLENVAANPSWACINWKERLCLLVEGGVQYSKKRVDGDPVEFSDAFIIQVETIGGRGTGLAVLDDKLIIFKKDRIYYVAGDGPNDTGTFGQFSNPIAIQSDVGCVSPKSIVSTDAGIIFQSSKGIYMLLRNLTISFIGAGVEYFLESQPTITSALLLEVENQVRFLTASNDCLVYDYLIGQWSVFTNHAGQDLALYNNRVVRIDSTSKVVIETPGVTFTDYNSGGGSTDYSLKIRTGWMSFADLQGFMRVYRFLLLGKFKSHHILTVKVAYDYNPKVIDTYSFDTQGAGKSLTVIPDAALYENTAFSGTDIYQFRGHLSKQKCEAIQLTIEDTSLAGTKESYALTNIAFEVGIKNAVFKKPAAFSNV